ncbi:MAG: helix-turn-helix domain-containing protein [Lactobacillaceae bacterium]|nr:helix-turn-helix domain-containing protein [Lactobacillaceae bacterium]
MAEIQSNQNEICPCALTISLLSSKWKILIIRDLLKGTQRYTDLKHSVIGISQKMLTQSLKEMESDGLVNRKVYPEVPPRVEYSLTATGKTLRPVIGALNDWGTQFIKNNPADYLNQRFNLSLSKNQWLRAPENACK